MVLDTDSPDIDRDLGKLATRLRQNRTKKMKPERDQQRATEHDERADSSRFFGKVRNQMVGYVEHTRGENQAKDNDAARPCLSGELLVDRNF
jgi:hypothetical protein